MSIFHWYLDSYKGLSRSIWILTLVTLVNRAGMMVIPFLSVYMTSELGYTLSQTSVVMMAFGAGSVVGVFLGGKLTDLFGYYIVQYASLILNGIAFILLSFVESHSLMVIAVFCATAIADSFRPAVMTAISAYSKPENQTRSISLNRLAINFGFSIGPLTGGFIAGYYGYEMLFYLDGITCILGGLLILLLLKNAPVEREKEEDDAKQNSTKASPYSDKAFMFNMFLTFLLALGFLQLFTTVPPYWKGSISLSEEQIGLLFAINGILLAVFEVPVIHYLEKRFHLFHLISIGTLLIACAFGIFGIGHSFQFMALGMIVASFGEMISLPFTATVALNFSKPSTRGQYMSIYGFSWSGAHLLGPAIGMSMAAQVGFQSVFWTFGVVSALAALGFTLFNKTKD